MKYRYDYDVKDDLMELLQRKNDFSGAEELRYYFQIYQNEENSIKKNLMKFCIYKLSANLADVEIKSFDCDVSKGIIESFQKTYAWLNDSICQNQKDRNGNSSPVKYELLSGTTSYRGDTMTSIWTTLKEYIKLKIGVSKINENDTWEMFILRECKKINLSFHAGEFLELGHSIGNFIPVPQGFNVGRSNWGKWDYWDLTLYQIYQWYRDNNIQRGDYNNRALETLFRNDRNKQTSIEYCVLWLERFGTWENFVKQNCMESFVDEKGVPKRFFKNHSLNYPIPKTIKEFEEFFETVNECIANRGKTIINIFIQQGYISAEETEQLEEGALEKGNNMDIEITKEYLREVIEWESKKNIADGTYKSLIVEEKQWIAHMDYIPKKRRGDMSLRRMLCIAVATFFISLITWIIIGELRRGHDIGLLENLLTLLLGLTTTFVLPFALPIYLKIKELRSIKLDFESEKEKAIRIKTQSEKSIYIIRANQEKLKETYKYIQENLEKLYNANIIYKKYCNIEACATILEYLDSGRCYELEGPYGAYNKFDNDSAHGEIITKLENISSKMDIIIANQKGLEAIAREINGSIHEMQADIKVICATTQNIDRNVDEIAEATKIAAWSSAVLATQVPRWGSEANRRMRHI